MIHQIAVSGYRSLRDLTVALGQLGRLARDGVQVVMHNTLAASDYGLIDEATLVPRPNYWCALLWRKLMGTTVFDCGTAGPGLHVYAHSLRDRPDGVAVLALNTDRTQEQALELPAASERFTLTARELQARAISLNGAPLQLLPDGTLPTLTGQSAPAGVMRLPPASITFVAIAA